MDHRQQAGLICQRFTPMMIILNFTVINLFDVLNYLNTIIVMVSWLFSVTSRIQSFNMG